MSSWLRNVILIGTLAISARAYGEDQLVAAVDRVASPQELKSLSLEDLGNVQVTSYSKIPTELWRTPAAVYLISSDDIERSGATSIADVLRLAPGVEVAHFSSTSWAVGIRGLQNNFSKSVLVLIDGRNLYTPLFAGVYWDVQDMPLDTIDHVEVIRGPGGTIWGPDAANGVINIITKSATETHGVTANALAGTQDHTIDDLQYGAKLKSVDYRIFGRGFERRHEYHTDGIDDDTWHQERVGARLDAVAGRDSYFAEADAYLGTSPHIVGTTPLYDVTSGGDVNLRWQRDLKNGQGFYLQAYFERSLRTSPITLGEQRNTFDIDFIQHIKIAGNQQLTYGGGLRWSPYLITPPNPNETLIPAKATDHSYTGFLQDEIRLGDRVTLTAGAKLQQNNFSGFDIQPSARLLWSLGEHQSLWFGFTRAVTTPSDLEENFFLQGGAGHTFVQLLGNKKFMSENVEGYEAGYRILRGERFYLDLSSFWSNYTNLQSFSAASISSSGGNTTIAIQYQNQIAGHTSGFEFAPQVSVAPWWRLNTSYSFVSSNFSANGPTSDISSTGSVSTYEGSTPRHLVSVQSKMDLPWHLQLNQMYRFVSALRAQKVEAYQTMDVTGSRSLGRDVAIKIVGQNLFQPHHKEWGTGDPNQAPEGIYRAAYIQLSFRSGTPQSH
ncbi:MAG TPA: TonB-dependent receptor [Acidobacteriaceae bacterium]|nr:TonB-dependent receptor [Acidobacteriaceae bacterium]